MLTRRRWIPVLTIFLCVALFGQYSGDFVLGSKRLFGVPAPYLSEATPISEAVTSPMYLASVGGVAFDQVAKPAAGISGAIALTYDASAPDGERLNLLIGGEAVKTQIYDWMLVPVAKFANSRFTACFTLFGTLSDPKRQAEVEASIDQNKRAMNYHPNLANTLVGLRMFQLDEHILSPDSVDLPKSNGEYVLGAGERAPDIQRGLAALASLDEGIDALPSAAREFQSYLICDYKRQVEFSVVQGKLRMTGTPYYYFWRAGDDDKPIYMRQLSDWVSEQQALLRQINPAVWDAGVNLMQYAAFFRHCKKSYPAVWQKFLAQVAAVSPRPEVKTPTFMIDQN
jgi:hypothetical protein